MKDEFLFQRGTTYVRRLQLSPGEAMPWHRDPFHRVTVVLRGDVLAIEYRDESEGQRFTITPGQVDWDEPTDRVHRGVNVGVELMKRSPSSFLTIPVMCLSRGRNSQVLAAQQSTRGKCIP